MEKKPLALPLAPSGLNPQLQAAAEKIIARQRLSPEDGLALYQHAGLALLGMLANAVREDMHADATYFNRNIHLEPTNICLYDCAFCAFSRKEGEEGSWEYTAQEMVEKICAYPENAITEVHIVGGVHPQRDAYYFADIIRAIKAARPALHVKAFTAVELDYMIRKAGLKLEAGLQLLKDAGLGSLPGGGAEIFDKEIRAKICGQKSPAHVWLKVHETAHSLGIPSNATMLYGHYEQYSHRISHLEQLRELQDRTGGFNAFIPLKYRHANNELSFVGEVPALEDLRNYAVSRLYLDNIPHIKAYWPMIGKATAQLSLSFGVNDVDGTIDDTTKIYSMAGAEDKNPSMNTQQMVKLIQDARRQAIERDSIYNVLKAY